MRGLRWTLTLLSLFISVAFGGRPLVRNVRTNAEFMRLLNYHKDVTGMGVIVDFYSDGCGPCRMIAPHYKELAKRYKDQVVFAKVDVNFNRETSSMQRIRSMPTFQFYMNGKKRHQFSGGDLQGLQMWAGTLAREFKENNIKVTRESLESFYAEHAPDKATAENIDKVMQKAGGEKGGKGHRSLVKALKKKYGVGPATELRYDPSNPKETKQQQTTPPPSTGKASTQKTDPAKPNLHLASIEDLEAELEKRKAEREAAREEAEDNGDDEEEEDEKSNFPVYQPEDGITERLAIIGAGPAGLSAAVYAARAGLKPVVIAPPSGGQLQGKGVLVENYPAVTDSTGPAVVFEMQKQAAKFGTLFLDDTVTQVELSKNPGKEPHIIKTNNTEIRAMALIIATGANSRWLEVEGEERFKGGGVSACATCDGYLYRDKPVIVVGGGDTAMESSLHLAATSSLVTIVHRGDSFSKASVVMRERVLNHDKIKVIWNSTVESFHGRAESQQEMEHDPHVTAHGADPTEPEQPLLTHVMIKDRASNHVQELACDGAFVAIGHDPNTWLFKNQLEMNAHGYLKTKYPSTLTSRDGVFAAGDVADPIYRQAITSAGTGAMAALDAERWIHENGIEDQRKAAEDEFMQELLEEIQTNQQQKTPDVAKDEECDS